MRAQAVKEMMPHMYVVSRQLPNDISIQGRLGIYGTVIQMYCCTVLIVVTIRALGQS